MSHSRVTINQRLGYALSEVMSIDGDSNMLSAMKQIAINAIKRKKMEVAQISNWAETELMYITAAAGWPFDASSISIETHYPQVKMTVMGIAPKYTSHNGKMHQQRLMAS